MILSTVLASVNENEKYYMFIPKQIKFWKKFGIKFVAVYVGEKIPEVLQPFAENIILYNRNLDLNTVYLGQNLRIYMSCLLDLPDNEMVMITDMDMLPMKGGYYKRGLEKYTKEDFIYYRHVEDKQIFMCYNAAHPSCWSKVFGIQTMEDVDKELRKNYNNNYDGVPGSCGWFIDQKVLYKKLIKYERLHILNRDIKRLEVHMYHHHLSRGDKYFVREYHDFHAHRDYYSNKELIENAEKQLGIE
jgi:hypothetical protein